MYIIKHYCGHSHLFCQKSLRQRGIEYLCILIILYQWYSTVFENIQVKAPKMVLLHFHPTIF